jgi:hypothetical protein
MLLAVLESILLISFGRNFRIFGLRFYIHIMAFYTYSFLVVHSESRNFFLN